MFIQYMMIHLSPVLSDLCVLFGYLPNDHDDQVQEALKNQGVRKFIGSSGGNAGVAMAVAAKAGHWQYILYSISAWGKQSSFSLFHK